MANPKLPQPTVAELGILRVLWRRGPSTVREIHEELNRTRRSGYTTVLKFLQIMTEKGLVTRDDSARSHVYRARLVEHHTQRHIVRDMLERAFGGSASKLVTAALSAKKASRAELKEIRKLLDELEE